MKRRNKKLRIPFSYAALSLIGLLMIYPLIWMFFASFKTNREIFSSISLFPEKPVFDAFINGWKGSGQYSYTTFFLNNFKFVIPCVVFSIISSSLVAYGFARFRFRLKKICFAIVIATLMLPSSILIIPRYILFSKFDWLNTYLPIVVPCIFATESFFIFLLVQFMRGIPYDLDEAARIDGCNSFAILVRILLPLLKPALFSVGLFQFMWQWNDFFNVLIYINSVRKYPLSLALRMSLDVNANVAWNQVIAMSFCSIVPVIFIFFFAQKYFVEGISTTGLKG